MTKGSRMAALVLALLPADAAAHPGVVRQMTPGMIQEALRRGASSPGPEASREGFREFQAAMSRGERGFYPLGHGWFTTPYSRVVREGIAASEAGRKPLVLPEALVPELHVYIAPMGRFSRGTDDLIVTFIRPVGSTNPNENIYPLRVEAADQAERAPLYFDADVPVFRASFPLEALASQRELVTVFEGIVMQCQGPICVDVFDLTNVR